MGEKRDKISLQTNCKSPSPLLSSFQCEFEEANHVMKEFGTWWSLPNVQRIDDTLVSIMKPQSSYVLTLGYNIMIQVVVVDCNGKFLLPIFVGFPTNDSKVLFKFNLYKNVQMFFTLKILIESKKDLKFENEMILKSFHC
jgi:hypothetical protein